MTHHWKILLKWAAAAVLFYLLLVVCALGEQMFSGAVGDADADLVDQPMQPVLTQVIESVRTIVTANRTPVYQRDAHAKAHGCVRAVFEVSQTLDPYRFGIFAAPRTYQAWIRFSNGRVPVLPDSAKDARGMAVKVMGVKGKQLLDPRLAGATQDFVMITSPNFFVRRLEDYAELERQSARNTPFRYFFADGSPNPFRWKLRELYLGLSALKSAPTTPLSEQYYSASAYRLDTKIMKFSARPCDVLPDPGIDRSTPNFLRDALKATLRRRDACFEFMVQLRDDGAHMPVEDTTVRWSERVSPFVPVARIFVPQQQFDTPAQNEMCENLSFNPWHGIVEHEPLGKLNVLRRDLYAQTAAFRRGHNDVPPHEPTDWCDALPAHCRAGQWVD